MIVKNLHSVHTHIAHTSFGMHGMDKRQGDKPTAIGRPAFQRRKHRESRLIAKMHHLLTLSPALTAHGEPLGNITQQRQYRHLVTQRILGRGDSRHQRLDAGGQLAQVVATQRTSHTTTRAEEAGNHGERFVGAGKEESTTTAFAL